VEDLFFELPSQGLFIATLVKSISLHNYKLNVGMHDQLETVQPHHTLPLSQIAYSHDVHNFVIRSI